MTATASYGVTGDPYLDGVLSGIKWGVTNLTFSFPTDSSFYGTAYGSGENLNAFEAFTAQQAAAVRDILKMYSAVSDGCLATRSSSVGKLAAGRIAHQSWLASRMASVLRSRVTNAL